MAKALSPTLVRRLKILKHDCFEEKQKDGNVLRSFSVEAAYEFGQPAVRLYIQPEKAQELREATGNGFTRDELREKPFEPYEAQGEFDLVTKQVVRRGESANRDRENNQLGVKLLDLQLGRAA